MTPSTEIRWTSFASALTLFGIVLLQSGSTWTVSVPASGSSRTQTANVGGGGMTTDAPGAPAVFHFGIFQPPFLSENNVSVTAQMSFWNGTIPAPSGGWSLSPVVNEYPVGDHYAWIEWVDGSGAHTHSTANHIVQ